MRIVQVIDSLEAGGAERMAVNYANALVGRSDFSGLVTSRQEGALKDLILPEVNYLHLNKTRTLDFAAARRLRKYCIDNKVTIIHAHSTSYFIAMLTKLLYPKLRIIWHDHNGMSEFINSRESAVLKMASYFFDGIIVVNNRLKQWASDQLHCRNVLYLPNFTDKIRQNGGTTLFGSHGKRILCLANLRLQKNHFLLIEVATMLRQSHPQWTFHLVGKDFEDDYSAEIRNQIIERQLDQHVFIYGSKNDTSAILEQSDIAILTSSSEGLPVALLEYGLHKLPVVVTSVGEIPLIIKNGIDGFMVSPDSAADFYNALVRLIDEPALRSAFASELFQSVMQNNSGSTVISQYLNWLEQI